MSKYIGDVSAYAYAVSKGYTGTEEEFAELMASYANVGQTAVDAKDAAVAAKTAAQTAATTATNKASEATTAAQTATTKAGEAQTSAQTASTKASEASQSASTASQKATESAQSASQALSYKNDAESAKTASQTAQGLAEDARDSAVQAKTDAESARDEAQNLVDGISGKVEQIDSNTERIESLEDDRYKPYVVDSASGSIASFPDGADDIPLKSLTVTLEPIQDTSQGDPSPENICPISGWTGCEVSATGKNLFNKDTCQVIDKYFIDASGNAVSHTNYAYTETYQPVESNTQYVFSGTIVGGGTYNAVAFYDKDKHFISRFMPTQSNVGAVFTTPSNCAFIRWNMRSGVYDLSTIQLEKSGDATVYESFGRSITIDLGQTVYGAKLYPLEGKALVDKKMLTIASSMVSTVGTTSSGIKYAKLGTLNDAKSNGYIFADRYANSNDASRNSTIRLASCVPYIYDNRFVDNATAEALIDGVVCVYELSTPIEIQLIPNEVNSLLGQNNIFADTGDTDVEYRADTRLYIEKLTQPEEDDMIADSNIVSGQYFMVGNSLYKATANIANGGQITVGTNCTRVSLAQALNEINA